MEILKRVFITRTDNLFKKYLHEEMEVLVNLFTKKGQNRKELETVTLKYIDKITHVKEKQNLDISTNNKTQTTMAKLKLLAKI